MQGTGNNALIIGNNVMSIRQLLDGHNFNFTGTPLVMFDTAKTVLVPDCLYDKRAKEDYLRFNGMELASGEKALASDERDGIVAVMGITGEVGELVRERFGEEFRVSSPLLEIAGGRKRDVNIFLTGENAYVVVWEKGLKAAEVLPDNSPDSILYYMQVLGRQFRLKKFDINVGGERAGTIAGMLQRYFPGVKVAL